MPGKSLLFSLLIFIVSGSVVYSQSAAESSVDSILREYYGKQSPGVSVMILKNGESLMTKSYGYANLKDRDPADENTNYHLASLTEQFTAMAVLMLKDAGKAELDQKITEIWNDLPEYCSEVTLNHLLRHTSGLPYLSHKEFYRDVKNLGDIIAFLDTKEQLTFEPGKKAAQNPLNVALLATYVEEVSGKSFKKFVEANIFETLGMENSEVHKSGWFARISNKATSYIRRNNNVYEPAPELPKDYYEGVIGVFSGLTDMQYWLKAWKSDTLLTRSTLQNAERINFIRGQNQFPGYGWYRAFNKGQKYLYAGGIGNGNSHIILRVPTEQIDVIILSNQSSLFGLRKKAFELVNLYSEKQYETR